MQPPIMVLGMHRSGTSALTGMLVSLGMAVGEGLIPGNDGNRKGYFERLDLLFIQETILRGLGASWHDSFPLPDGWWTQPEMAPHRKEILAILNREFEKEPFWGVKDPRLCRLLPLWLEVFKEMKRQPQFVFVLRNPNEVAASLEKRNGFPREKSWLMWLTYILEAEYYSRPYSRVFVTMDALLTDWRKQANRIETALNLKWPNAIEEAAPEIDPFLSPELRHHVDSPKQPEGNQGNWSLFLQAQKALEAAGNDAKGRADGQFDAVRKSYDATNHLFAPLFKDAETIEEKGKVDLDLLGKMVDFVSKNRG